VFLGGNLIVNGGQLVVNKRRIKPVYTQGASNRLRQDPLGLALATLGRLDSKPSEGDWGSLPVGFCRILMQTAHGLSVFFQFIESCPEALCPKW
jgi:hypothetical protein